MDSKMKLLNARLIDGTGKVHERVDIELDGPRFGEITPSAEHAGSGSENPGMGETLDLAGKTVLPGLFDCHIHITLNAAGNPDVELQTESVPYKTLMAAVRAEKMLRAGITTTRDLGGADYMEMALKKAVAEGHFKGPRFLVAGKVLTMTGGHGWWIGTEVDSQEEARKAARHNIKMGADCIKMMATGGVMTPNVDPNNVRLLEEELRAGFLEAHKAGKISATHAMGAEGIKNAIRAGVRTVEHGVYLDEEGVQLMLQHGTFLDPTLSAPKQIVDAGIERGVPKFMVDKSVRVMEEHFKNTERAFKSGVKVACGSDAGTPFNPHEDIFTEIFLLTQIGMTNMDALVAATAVYAQALKLDDKLGTVEKGKLADLVVYEGDPLADLNVIKSPAMVWKEGVRYF